MEHTVDKQTMEALETLAKTNMQIGEAKDALQKLKDSKTEYIKEREVETLALVQRVLVESAEVFKEVQKNFTDTQQFQNTVSDFAKYLVQAQTEFAELVALFEEYSTLRNAEAQKQLDEIAEQRKAVKAAHEKNEADREELKTATKNLGKEVKKVADLKGTLERGIKRLKEGRI